MTKQDLAILRSIPKKRRIYLRGFISEKTANNFIRHFRRKAKSLRPMRLVIISHGGETHAAVRIHDAVKSAISPVYGVVGKRADSAALMILQACKLRVARADARFNIHPNFYKIPFKIWAFMDEEKTVAKFRDAVELYKPALETEWTTLIYPVYKAIERAGRSQEEFLDFISRDPVLSPSQALEWGLIDEIIRRS